ncbi:MAG: PIN domain-containing protein [Xanthomonadales bacterium]
MGSKKRLYIIDTNVLMHDPTSIFRFEEHDVFLPMMVLEELDAAKKGLSEVARNVRQVSRFIGEMMQRQHTTRLDQGLELREPDGLELQAGTGRLFFQTTMPEMHSSLLRDGSFADNEILSTALSLQKSDSGREIILVSKDINLRIKAAILGVQAEDYYNDRALDDLSLLYQGLRVHDEGFWEAYPQLESWNENGRAYYRINHQDDDGWYPNQCVAIGEENGIEALVNDVTSDKVVLRLVDDYYASRNSVWGIHARNREQNFALNLLMDPEIDFVTLMGTAGTGKTLLALAAGLAQTMGGRKILPWSGTVVAARGTSPFF